MIGARPARARASTRPRSTPCGGLVEAGARPRPAARGRRRAHGRRRQRAVPSRDERRTRPHRLTPPRGPPPRTPPRPRVGPRAPRSLSLLLAWCRPYSGAPTRLFHLTADPFARGQHRGVDFPARGAVRSACSGRVVFAGRVAGEGTVSVRCGRWRVSYAPLARVAVRAGEPVGPGESLGRTARGIHFGVRREGRRFGYVDPLRFLGCPPCSAASARRAARGATAAAAEPAGRPALRSPGHTLRRRSLRGRSGSASCSA